MYSILGEMSVSLPVASWLRTFVKLRASTRWSTNWVTGWQEQFVAVAPLLFATILAWPAWGNPVELLVVRAEDYKPIPHECRAIFFDKDSQLVFSVTTSGATVPLPSSWQRAARLQVECPGYVDLKDVSGIGRPIETLSPNGGALVVDLTQTSQISGTIYQLGGRPMPGAIVSAYARSLHASILSLSPVGSASRSDDSGKYRLFDLPPGQYFVAALSSSDVENQRLLWFHPNSVELGNAVIVDTKSGTTQYSVDIHFEELPTVSIIGDVGELPDLAEGERVGVQLHSVGQNIRPIAFTVANREGGFSFKNVPTGRYEIAAWAPFGGFADNSPVLATPFWTGSATVNALASESRLRLHLEKSLSLEFLLQSPTDSRHAPCGGANALRVRSKAHWLAHADLPVEPRSTSEIVVTAPTGDPLSMFAIEGGTPCDVLVEKDDEWLPAIDVPLFAGASDPVSMKLLSASANLKGLLTAPDKRHSEVFVYLVPILPIYPTRVTTVAEDGSFGFENIVAGHYQAFATTRSGSDRSNLFLLRSSTRLTDLHIVPAADLTITLEVLQ